MHQLDCRARNGPSSFHHGRINELSTSHPTRPGAPDPESVVQRLEEAGRTLLALPNGGPSTRLVQSGLEWVRDAGEAYNQVAARIRPAVPNAAQITRMDEALAWIPLIPIDKFVIRRIVGARSLVSPTTGRYLYTWRRLGIAINADHKAVQRWHAQGIELIVASLVRMAAGSHPGREPSLPQPSRHHGGAHA